MLHNFVGKYFPKHSPLNLLERCKSLTRFIIISPCPSLLNHLTLPSFHFPSLPSHYPPPTFLDLYWYLKLFFKDNELERSEKDFIENPSALTYRALGEALMSKMIVFNRKRGN